MCLLKGNDRKLRLICIPKVHAAFQAIQTKANCKFVSLTCSANQLASESRTGQSLGRELENATKRVANEVTIWKIPNLATLNRNPGKLVRQSQKCRNRRIPEPDQAERLPEPEEKLIEHIDFNRFQPTKKHFYPKSTLMATIMCSFNIVITLRLARRRTFTFLTKNAAVRGCEIDICRPASRERIEGALDL